MEQKGSYILLRVHVQPKASRNAFVLEPAGRLKVALTAPPVEGAANKALLEFVAKTLEIPKSAVTLIKGEKSREKVLTIAGITIDIAKSKIGI